MHMPSLITDLAFLLMTAAMVTIIFRRLKLPLILGYILAGFVTGPYFPYFYDVSDQNSIDTWSEIGVIIILFHIGLEFSLPKMANLGTTAIVTAAVKMSGVMVTGYGLGILMGLGTTNSMFLGAMLSISSTVVIKKSFEELGVQGESYASLVMGSLVMEDVLGIFLMVILSTLSVSQSVNGMQLILSLLMMLMYLVVWLLLGIFFLPTFLNKVADLMSDEVLTVLSMGLCFFMAYIAHLLGFSMDLGAFLAGSLLAGTVHAGRIEKVTLGIKDMFGAIFFLSVGMMVDPSVIAEKWMVIVPVAVIAVIAKLIFATIGMVLSGQRLGTAIKGGISLAPIGEFSFIIASLGISLKVMDKTLYPMIVAAAIMTMIFTPVFIKKSDKAVEFISGHMPAKLKKKIEDYTCDSPEEKDGGREWPGVLRDFFRKVLLNGVVMLMVTFAGIRFVEPAMEKLMPEDFAKAAALLGIYLFIALFSRPLLDFHNVRFTNLWMESRSNRPPLVVLTVLKLCVVALIAYIPLHAFFGADALLFLAAAIAAIVFVGRSDFIRTWYLQMETRFLRNLNERLIAREEKIHGKQHWMDEDFSIISFYVPKDALYQGYTLEKLNWGRNQDVYVVKIRRGGHTTLMPPGRTVIHAGDKVYVVGSEKSLENFCRIRRLNPRRGIRTLKEFMETDYPDTASALSVLAIEVQGTEPYSGKAIRNTDIQSRGRCMILGIQKDGMNIPMPDAGMMIRKGDILWLIGSNKRLARMAALSTEA